MISIIVAMAQNRVIGKNNKMPWHISEDLRRFKRITTGHTVVMGRKTYASIGKPLPRRKNIVLTRDVHFSATGVDVIHSIEALKEICSEQEEIFIIGGAEIYRQFLPLAEKIYLTLIKKDVEGDAYFPTVVWERDFQELERSEEKMDSTDNISYQFVILKRKAKRKKRINRN